MSIRTDTGHPRQCEVKWLKLKASLSHEGDEEAAQAAVYVHRDVVAASQLAQVQENLNYWKLHNLHIFPDTTKFQKHSFLYYLIYKMFIDINDDTFLWLFNNEDT